MSGAPFLDVSTSPVRLSASEVYACSWDPYDWEYAAEESVQPGWDRTRSQARARFAIDYEYDEVQAWRRYIRVLDRQEKYEFWVEQQDGGWDGHPDVMPEEWDADRDDESLPHWAFVHRTDPRGTPVWVCGERAKGAPVSPRKS